MALRLVEMLVDETAAKACQLMIEYDPQPPFDSGSHVQEPARPSSPGSSNTPSSAAETFGVSPCAGS